MTRACLLVIAIAMLAAPRPLFAFSVEWTRQLGTSGIDVGIGVSADGLGNVFISGYTYSSLGGPNAGSADPFVSKYDAAGLLLWTRQFGTSDFDYSSGVSADRLGNVFLSGETLGSLGGDIAGFSDAFLSKYDAAGLLLWTRQLGTSERDEGSDVSADGLGNVYLSGTTNGSLGGTNARYQDAFLSKYDETGSFLWARQIGTSSGDFGTGVSADGLGNVYLSGLTNGSLGEINTGGGDVFVSKFDAAGTLLWTRQLGSSADDISTGVSADGLGNVYVSGYHLGSLGGPSSNSYDAFLSKYDAAGTLLWIRQLGTPADYDISTGVSADGLGNVYLSGYSEHHLVGLNTVAIETFVSKYDAAGSLLWTRQRLGAADYDIGNGVSADGLGNVYLSGITRGSQGGPHVGNDDAFVAKYSDGVIPEPSGALLAVLTLSGGLSGRYGRGVKRRESAAAVGAFSEAT